MKQNGVLTFYFPHHRDNVSLISYGDLYFSVSRNIVDSSFLLISELNLLIILLYAIHRNVLFTKIIINLYSSSFKINLDSMKNYIKY